VDLVGKGDFAESWEFNFADKDLRFWFFGETNFHGFFTKTGEIHGN